MIQMARSLDCSPQSRFRGFLFRHCAQATTPSILTRMWPPSLLKWASSVARSVAICAQGVNISLVWQAESGSVGQGGVERNAIVIRVVVQGVVHAGEGFLSAPPPFQQPLPCRSPCTTAVGEFQSLYQFLFGWMDFVTRNANCLRTAWITLGGGLISRVFARSAEGVLFCSGRVYWDGVIFG